MSLEQVDRWLRRHLHTGLRGGVEALLVVLVCLKAEPTPRALVCGALVSGSGLALRLWTSGLPAGSIAPRGPYRFVRHPHLLGSALVFLGLCLAGRSAAVMAIAMLVLAALHSRLYGRVDESTAVRSGPAFTLYREQVPAFLPRLWPYRAASASPGGRFSWQQALLKGHHRELDALLALLAAWGAFYALTSWPQQARLQQLSVGLVVTVSIAARFVYYRHHRRWGVPR